MLRASSVSHNRGEWKVCRKGGRPLDYGGDEPELTQGCRRSALGEAGDGRTGTDHRNLVEYPCTHILSAESYCCDRAGDLQRRRGVVAAG